MLVFFCVERSFSVAKSICDKIRSIKSSLENAERSFRDNREMRGELDLMLAEAEIKHLREKRKSISVFNRQCLAVVAAAALFLAGYGGWLYATSVEGVANAPKQDLSQVIPDEINNRAANETNSFNQDVVIPKEVTLPGSTTQEIVQSTQNIASSKQVYVDVRELVRQGKRTLRDEE